MRLIDADKLKKTFEDTVVVSPMPYAFVKQIIDNAPTVEYPEAITIKCDTEEGKQKLLSALRNASARLEVRAEEDRPTGKWVFIDNDVGWDKCSNCNWTDTRCHSWNYCPNCGARMEAENE